MNENRKQIATFLFLTLALSAVFYALIIKSGHLASNGGSYVLGLMWCPGLAALLTRKLHGQGLDSLGWKWGASRYQVMSYLIPLVYASMTYIAVWITRQGGIPNRELINFVGQRFGLGSLSSGIAVALYLLFAVITGLIRG